MYKKLTADELMFRAKNSIIKEATGLGGKVAFRGKDERTKIGRVLILSR